MCDCPTYVINVLMIEEKSIEMFLRHASHTKQNQTKPDTRIRENQLNENV